MEVKSILLGKRGVSLPFSDYCNPILDKDHNFNDVLDFLISYGKKCGWKYIEFRGGERYLHGEPAYEEYYGHTLDLSGNQNEIFSHFRNNNKRNIKKAINEGVMVKILTSFDALKEFFILNCITRKKHGLPPQPVSFFKNIDKHVVSKGHGFICLAYYKKKVIAGAVFFHFGTKALYKFGASDHLYQHLRANNLIIWDTIKYYQEKGYKHLCFGRTGTKNTGLRQFKRGWNVEENTIKYYRYDLGKMAFTQHASFLTGLYKKAFSYMPLPVLKIAGSLFYKYMG